MADLDRDAPVYSIGVVSQLTGLTARQIRYYEKAGLLEPARTPGNQRLYSPNQVDLLLEVKALLTQGYNLEGVKGKLAARAADRPAAPAHRPQGGGESPPEPPAAPERPVLSSEEHLRFIQALRSGRPLSSLYPVDNQAELVRRLQERRSADSP